MSRCSMTSPQRRTSSSALAAEPQQHGHAKEEQRHHSALGAAPQQHGHDEEEWGHHAAAVRPMPTRQVSGDSNLNAEDRGHIFHSASLEDDKGHLSQRVSVSQATPATSSSFRAASDRHLAAAESEAARQAAAGIAHRHQSELPQGASSHPKSSLTAALNHAQVKHDSPAAASAAAAAKDEAGAESDCQVRATAELDKLLKIYQSMEKQKMGVAESDHRHQGYLGKSPTAVPRAAANRPQGSAAYAGQVESAQQSLASAVASAATDQVESAQQSSASAAASDAAAQPGLRLVASSKGTARIIILPHACLQTCIINFAQKSIISGSDHAMSTSA